MSTQEQDYGGFFRLDASAWMLVASNLITLVLALYEGWSFGIILWIYWTQSIIIGIFSFIRILTIGNDSRFAKYFISLFFLVHYGIFHLVYFVFLSSDMFGASAGFGGTFYLIAFNAAIFFANHLFSFAYNYKKDSAVKQDSVKLMSFPYARILPMHLIIFAAALFSPGMALTALFLIMKTAADLAMHQVEHRMLKR